MTWLKKLFPYPRLHFFYEQLSWSQQRLNPNHSPIYSYISSLVSSPIAYTLRIQFLTHVYLNDFTPLSLWNCCTADPWEKASILLIHKGSMMPFLHKFPIGHASHHFGNPALCGKTCITLVTIKEKKEVEMKMSSNRLCSYKAVIVHMLSSNCWGMKRGLLLSSPG